MRANDGSRTGGEVLIDQLVIHGVRHVFCVPGESYIAALDALHNRPIVVTTCRQEGGAGVMKRRAASKYWRALRLMRGRAAGSACPSRAAVTLARIAARIDR